MAGTEVQAYNDPTGVSDLTAAALHSLANNAFATLTEYDNSLSGNLNFVADFELYIDLAAAATAGNLSEMYLLVAVDGTNYIDTNGPPPGAFACAFVHQAVDPSRLIARDVPLPPYKFKPYFKNGSGQTTAASGSTLKMIARRQQAQAIP